MSTWVLEIQLTEECLSRRKLTGLSRSMNQGDKAARFFKRYKVGGQGVVQLGGLILGCSMQVPLGLKLVSLFYSLKVSLKFE